MSSNKLRAPYVLPSIKIYQNYMISIHLNSFLLQEKLLYHSIKLQIFLFPQNSVNLYIYTKFKSHDE